MVGMASVVGQLDLLIARALNNRQRVEAGLPLEPKTMHLVFSGPSGTGKTTVATKVGELYHALGLTPTEKVITAKKDDLIADFAGQTPGKTRKKFNEARGGVLFIDEAYALVQDDRDQYGKQAIDTLVEEMDLHRNDTVVIMAGYEDDMRRLMRTNEGLASRFSTTIKFNRYGAKERYDIFAQFGRKGLYTLGPGARDALKAAMEEVGAEGNARKVRNFYEKLTDVQGQRLVSEQFPPVPDGEEPPPGYGDPLPLKALKRFTRDDIERALQTYRQTQDLLEEKPLAKPKRKPAKRGRLQAVA